MPRLALAETFGLAVREILNLRDLSDALGECAHAMGFRYFALTHHVDFAVDNRTALRVHNYPSDWEEWFDARALGRFDPIHRASHVAGSGFCWADVPRLIPLTAGDRAILMEAAQRGICDGFTVPTHVPGEFNGSCSFAVSADQAFPRDYLMVAQLVGSLAFEAGRRLSQPTRLTLRGAALTDRQRECVLWAARGKTDWEIARILGVSHETVIQHLKHARERYGVQKRANLAVMALFDGSICFSDLFLR